MLRARFSLSKLSGIFALTLIMSLNSLTAYPNIFCGKPIFQLGAFTSSTQRKTHHVNIQGLIGDDFKSSKSSKQNLLIGLGYYLNWMDRPQVNLQYGINTFYLAPTKAHGTVIQENRYTNLSYSYSRTNYPIYLAAKAVFPCLQQSNVTFDLGMGPNIVCTKSFKEKSRDRGITIPDRHIFSGKNIVTFSATAGIGWKINNIFNNCSLEIDYRFFYLGQGELKRINSLVRNNLRTGNSYANALFISISI